MGICVYMLDGERSYENSEHRQTCTRSHTAIDGTRVWRGCTDNVPLSTRRKNFKADNV